jgi:site-specific DNA recombinase
VFRKIENKMNLAILYARVSSKEQEKEGYSIPAQLRLLKEYAQKNGLTIVKEFIDVETAKQAGRVNFCEMVRFLEKNPTVKIILVEKTDRLYRNFKDYVTIDDLDLEIHLVKEGEVLSKDSKSHQKFIHGIKVLLAKNYIDNLSEEVKKGQKEKAEQGEWPSIAPVGYRNNRETHRIEIDPQKAPFIRQLFEWYATGDYSLEMLCTKAKESGLFSRNSVSINKAGIHRILNNPIYYGEFIWKKKRYSGVHELIISRVLFEKVQNVFTQANHPKETKRNLPFAGLLTCGKCGCSMTPELHKGKYAYYRCTKYRGECDNVYVREEELAVLMGEIVLKIRIDKETVNWFRQALEESHTDKVDFHRQAMDALQKRYNKLQGMIDAAYEDKLAGDITPEFWERKSTEWNWEMSKIQTEIDDHQKASMDYVKTGVQILELANKAYNLYLAQNNFERRRLLNILLLNCSFYHGTLYPTYRKPFDILAKGYPNRLMRGRRDLNSRPLA